MGFSIRRSALAAGLLALLASTPVLAQYSFTDLGLPNRIGKASLRSISGDGQVLVGEKPPSFLGETRPMSVTGYSDIHLLPLGPFGSGYAKKSSFDGSAIVGTVNMPGHEGRISAQYGRMDICEHFLRNQAGQLRMPVRYPPMERLLSGNPMLRPTFCVRLFVGSTVSRFRSRTYLVRAAAMP